MENRRVYITAVLSSEELKKALLQEANCIICNEIKLNVKIPSQVEIINADRYRVAGSHEAYAYNSQIIYPFCQKNSRYFRQNEISIQSCIRKLTYWTNYKTGYLLAALKELPVGYIRLNEVKFLPGNRWKSIFKYFKYLVSNNYLSLVKKRFKVFSVNQAQIGILVNNEFEFKLFNNVLSKLKDFETIVFHYGNIQTESLGSNEKLKFIDLSGIRNYSPQRVINPFYLSNEEIQILNIASSEWQSIAHEIARYQTIKKTGIKKLLLNVAENLPIRNLMHEVFGNDITVYNTMNGMKAGEAQDSDITFDKWFVWDQEMKEMMHQENGLAEDKLIISGHLSKDFLHHYIFKNTIGVDTEKLNGKVIISIFSVKGLREEKQEAFEVLYEIADCNSNFHFIVKPHPLENQMDYLIPNKKQDQVTWIDEKFKNSKEAVYDILHLSDLTIVFGSTVSMESNWMGVPCISFEKRDKSLIYNLKNMDIKHIQTKSELREAVVKTGKKTRQKPLETKTASDVIAAELMI